jgi:acetylornithine deacetylase/succinyl-diaminopimelate desuccinylase-like protein
MQGIKAYINNHKDRFLTELIELLRIPSISADSAYKNDVLKTADVVAEELKKAGCNNVEVCKTKGHPIVYGEKSLIQSYQQF